MRSIADTEIEGCIRRCLALGMTIDEVTLRMMDVTHRVRRTRSPDPRRGGEFHAESHCEDRASQGRARRATGIEKYNSNVDRRTSQNGPLVFSAFVAVVVFACVLGGGFALTGEFNVWWLLGALVVAWAATMCAHIAMQWEKVVIFRFGKFNRMAGPGLYLTIPFIEQTALKRRPAHHASPASALRRR